MAYYGILVNLLFYLYLEMHISFPEASTLVTNVVGTSALTPLLGAFIADAYIGRYWTIGIFSTIYLMVSFQHPSDFDTFLDDACSSSVQILVVVNQCTTVPIRQRKFFASVCSVVN